MKELIASVSVAIGVILLFVLILSPLAYLIYEMERPYTEDERASMEENCRLSGKQLIINADGNMGYCEKSKVETCIDTWVRSVDEKYDNPDTVSDLRETEYDNVVKQCQETFGDKK